MSSRNDTFLKVFFNMILFWAVLVLITAHALSPVAVSRDSSLGAVLMLLITVASLVAACGL